MLRWLRRVNLTVIAVGILCQLVRAQPATAAVVSSKFNQIAPSAEWVVSAVSQRVVLFYPQIGIADTGHAPAAAPKQKTATRDPRRDHRLLVQFNPDGKDKQLIVYVRQPVPGKRIVQKGFGDFGHSYIGIRDPASGKEYRYGFWPISVTDALNLGRSPGLIHEEDKTPWNIRRVFTISDANARKLIDNLNAQMPFGAAPEFKLETNNCTSWVLSEAAVAGVEIKTSQRCFGAICLFDPADLGEDFRLSGGEENKSFHQPFDPARLF